MAKLRKIGAVLISMVMVLSLSACSGIAGRIQNQIINSRNAGMVDGLYYDSKDKADVFLFRSGDDYFLAYVGSTGWKTLYSGAPSGITINDGDFYYLNADLTLVSGGVAGYNKAPSIKKIYSSQQVYAADVEQKGSLSAYNPDEKYFSGLAIHQTDTDCYIPVHKNYGEFKIYKDGLYIDSYDTKFDMDAALGLREKADATAQMEEFNNESIYVFRCGDRYLIYSKSIFFGDKGEWREFLNEEFGNEPLDFTLEDGQVVYMQKADLMRVNGGKGNYCNAPMYLKNYGMEEMQISTLTFAISMNHWEEGNVGQEFYCTQYGGGDTMILYLDGQYHVYRTKNGADEKVGAFDSIDEVNEAIGWNP